VHRFVYADEERTIRKGKKALDSLRESATQESVEPEELEESTPKRRGRKKHMPDYVESSPKRKRQAPVRFDGVTSESEDDEIPAGKKTSSRKIAKRKSAPAQLDGVYSDPEEDAPIVRKKPSRAKDEHIKQPTSQQSSIKRKYVWSGKYVGKNGKNVRNYSDKSHAAKALADAVTERVCQTQSKEEAEDEDSSEEGEEDEEDDDDEEEAATPVPTPKPITARTSNRRHTTDAIPCRDSSPQAPASITTKRKYIHSGKYTKAALAARRSDMDAEAEAEAAPTPPSSSRPPLRTHAPTTSSRKSRKAPPPLSRSPSPPLTLASASVPQKRKYVWSGRYARLKPPGASVVGAEGDDDGSSDLSWLQKGRPKRKSGAGGDADADAEIVSFGVGGSAGASASAGTGTGTGTGKLKQPSAARKRGSWLAGDGREHEHEREVDADAGLHDEDTSIKMEDQGGDGDEGRLRRTARVRKPKVKM